MAVPVTDKQVRILMRERTKGKSLEAAAVKANMSVNTAGFFFLIPLVINSSYVFYIFSDFFC